MIRIAVCDDDTRFTEYVRKEMIDYLEESHIEYTISVYERAKTLYDDMLEGKYFDLLWLDIEMPEMDGMTLASRIKEKFPHVVLIFFSGHEKYVYDTFEFGAYRYIPKNQMDFRFKRALADAVNKIERENVQYVYAKTKSKIDKVSIREIMCIQRDSKYSVIETYNEEIRKRKSLREIFEELPAGEFIWANRGTICNMAQIKKVDGDEVTLKNDKKVQLARENCRKLREEIGRYCLQH